ncbi:hypothetical protein [Glycomyces tenuis]|uniref:hypothetical protein n=1 Tax=Glycomyces tenuis TaxID=58116 RepID=UPI0012DFC0EF|nr:hypothetical protein [Glycomyces tenuis]
MFEAFANAMPLHRVARVDSKPPWMDDLDLMRFFCVMCNLAISGTRLADDDRHVFVTIPAPGWDYLDCIVCGISTVPTVEHSKKCDYCNGLPWWQVRELKEVL